MRLMVILNCIDPLVSSACSCKQKKLPASSTVITAINTRSCRFDSHEEGLDC